MWCRLGVTITIDPLPNEQPKEYIIRALSEKKVILDGDSYFPQGIIENFVGGDQPYDDVDFSMPKIRITLTNPK